MNAENVCVQDSWYQDYDISDSDKQILSQIAENMQRLGITNVHLIQNGLTERPFFVADGIWEDKRVIYKAMARKIPFQVSIVHEGIFLADIAPLLMEKKLPERLRNKIFVPKIFALALDNQIPAIVEEYFEGELLGVCDYVDTTMLSEQDIQDIVEFITIFRGFTREDLLALAPQSAGQLKFGKPDEERFDFLLEIRDIAVRSVLGEDYRNRLLLQLEEKRAFLNDAPAYFATIDIHAANILKNRDGQLMFIDWERINLSTNTAMDYDFLFTSLWPNPAMQELFFNLALEANKDVPYFKEFWRLSFMFASGSGILYYWYKQSQRHDLSLKDEVFIRFAIQRLKNLLQDALDKRGIWSV